MSEEYETERSLDRDEIADVFESFAGELRGDGEVTLAVGGEHVRINPPETCEFEVEVEEESSRFGAAERSIGFEIEWNRQDAERNLVD
ncbi:amphi-Trp domain-containing protein [Halococcus agarilyticus]|uniref:amphi-Trp domain-containing protein n=1 Tax=Halococcus agarilyticus TaxID=1232219 RepID=UPI0006780E2E|nr:amphi-Trp domain-containing protein [Halococcus agarilyticus]